MVDDCPSRCLQGVAAAMKATVAQVATWWIVTGWCGGGIDKKHGLYEPPSTSRYHQICEATAQPSCEPNAHWQSPIQ